MFKREIWILEDIDLLDDNCFVDLTNFLLMSCDIPRYSPELFIQVVNTNIGLLEQHPLCYATHSMKLNCAQLYNYCIYLKGLKKMRYLVMIILSKIYV